MTNKQYFISTKDGKIEVKGYPVVIPGYEEFSFFAHRPYMHYQDWEIRSKLEHGIPINHFWDKSWQISEEITGFNVSPHSYPGSMSNSTRKGALAIVTERFKAMGRDFVLPKLQSAVKLTIDTLSRERTRKAIDEVMA